MIYNGQEVGTPNRLTFPFTTDKIDWNINPAHTAAYKKIIKFRAGSEPIRRGQLKTYSDKDVCVFTKELGSKKVLVVANLRPKAISYQLKSPLLKNTRWKDAFSGNTKALKTAVSLEPYQYMVLESQ